jgi:hypothetical protein
MARLIEHRMALSGSDAGAGPTTGEKTHTPGDDSTTSTLTGITAIGDYKRGRARKKMGATVRRASWSL